MSENLRQYVKTLYGFDHVMKLLPERALKRQTPCADWKATDLIGHAFGGVKAVQVAATSGNMPKTWPKVGDNPYVAWSKLRDQALEALDQPNALHSMANTFFGPMQVDDFLPYMGGDLLIHTWDLARTGKVDERLDPGLCKQALAAWKTMPESMLRSHNVFGPSVKPAQGTDAQSKLLNFVGRTI